MEFAVQNNTVDSKTFSAQLLVPRTHSLAQTHPFPTPLQAVEDICPALLPSPMTMGRGLWSKTYRSWAVPGHRDGTGELTVKFLEKKSEKKLRICCENMEKWNIVWIEQKNCWWKEYWHKWIKIRHLWSQMGNCLNWVWMIRGNLGGYLWRKLRRLYEILMQYFDTKSVRFDTFLKPCVSSHVF